jgi:hypothetical protein
MDGHRFGWSGRPGIDRCRCGTERQINEALNPPYRWYWWYRLTDPIGLRFMGTVPTATLMEGQRSWPCPKAAA